MTAKDNGRMRKPKLTQELVDQAIELKADGLNDADIIAALGICASTFYRWLQKPDNKLKRSLKEGLKKAESSYKQVLLNTIKAAALEKTGNWTAAAWLLERKYPDEFGRPDRRREERTEEAPQIVLGVAVTPMPAGALSDGAANAPTITVEPVAGSLKGAAPALEAGGEDEGTDD